MIRTRLTLWNAFVFAIVLTLIGAVIYATTWLSLIAGVDAKLTRLQTGEGARMFGRGGGPEGPPPGPPPNDGGGGPRFDGGSWPGDSRSFGNPEARSSTGDASLPPRFNQSATSQLGSLGQSGANRRGPDRQGMLRRLPFGGLPLEKSAEFKSWVSRLLLSEGQKQQLIFEFGLHRPRHFFRHRSQGMPRDEALDEAALAESFLGHRLFLFGSANGRPLRILSGPSRWEGKQVAEVTQYGESLEDVDSAMRGLGTILLAIMPLALLTTTILGHWMTRRALKPVVEIAETAARIGATNLAERLPVRGGDEFATLALRFNSMLERIDSSFQGLARAYEAQRRFIADASHELKTPLTTVKGRVGVSLVGKQTAERYAEHMRSIGRAADTMSAIIQDLLFLARSDENKLNAKLEPCPFRELAASAIRLASSANPERVTVEAPADLEICVDLALFSRAVGNLLSNAIRHTPPEKHVYLRARREGPSTVIEVVDEGEGIPAEHLPHVFERFHRVDVARDRESGGTGLGLSIVRSIVEAHGGQVTLESELGQGATARIVLPAH